MGLLGESWAGPKEQWTVCLWADHLVQLMVGWKVRLSVGKMDSQSVLQ